MQAVNVPAIPDIARRFITLYNQKIIQEHEILLLQADYPEFFSFLISVINSDYFKLKVSVKSIYQAIELLGFERICNFTLCVIIYRTFNRIKIRGVDLEEFWEDSLRRAVSAQMLGTLIGLDTSRCFTAGFLQDLGLLLLFLFSPANGALWNEFRKREPEARYSMEHNVFNLNHDQALEILCKKWQLPDDISVAITSHHIFSKNDINSLDSQLASVLSCADWMSSVYTATDKGFVINRCRQILSEKFEMEPYKAEELLASIPLEIDLTAAALNIKIKKHIGFYKVLSEANIKLSEENNNFQELMFRLEQALEERDKLAAELNRDLSLAREIQKSLLPSDMGDEFPVIGMNISARDLSGDFYDYFRLSDGRIYFNLGDVSGKGVNAALLMAKTSSLFRCLGKTIDKPGELLSQINTELCETSIHGMFVTMVAGLYDPETKKLIIVNAGNPPALLLSPEGLAREIEAKAPPLGVLNDAQFVEVEYQLNNDSLYVYSDGVTEGYIKKDKTLGLGGFFKVIATMEKNLKPAQRLEKIIELFKDTAMPLRDDVTVLLLEDKAV